MKIRIHVTKEVLRRAMFCGVNEQDGTKIPVEVANVGSSCGIGLAVCDLLQNAWVSSDSIWIFDKKPDYNYVQNVLSKKYIWLPDEARNFIYDFDHATPSERANMQPISFDIDVPDSVIEKIGITEVHRILSESKTLERV